MAVLICRMLKTMLMGLVATLPKVLSTEGDDEWVDYTDMLRYDSVSQSMKGGDDPCAKCYKAFGLWAPIAMMVKHASSGDILTIGLTLLLGVLIMLIVHWLSRCFTQGIRAILRRGGERTPFAVIDAATQTPDLWGDQGGGVSHQQMPQEPEETSQHHRDREENEDIGKNPTDTEGDLISTQRELPARRASIDSERPNLPAGGHDTECLPMREEGDGGTDSEEYCSARFPVPETTEQT